MKHIGKIIALSGVIMLLSVRAYAQEIDVISPKVGTASFTSIGEGATDYEITSTQDSAGAMITKSGTLILFGDSEIDKLTVESDDGAVTVNIHDGANIDFAGNEADLSKFDITSGAVNVEFEMYLDDAVKTSLISAADPDGRIFAEAQLRFRRDDRVYVAYKNDKYNYEPLRTKLLPTDAWVKIKAVFDLDNKKMSLWADDEKIYENTSFVGEPSSLDCIAIGTKSRNIVIYTGASLDNAQLQISSTAIDINTALGNVVNASLSAKIKLKDSFEEIDAAYLTWSIDENPLCSINQNGMLSVDAGSLTEETAITAYCSVALGARIVNTSETVTLSPNGTQGTASDEAVVAGASLSKTSNIGSGDEITVMVPVYNPTASDVTYYIITALADANGKNVENYVFRVTAAANSGRNEFMKNMNVTQGSNLSARVFVLDESFSINVLKK